MNEIEMSLLDLTGYAGSVPDEIAGRIAGACGIRDQAAGHLGGPIRKQSNLVRPLTESTSQEMHDALNPAVVSGRHWNSRVCGDGNSKAAHSASRRGAKAQACE